MFLLLLLLVFLGMGNTLINCSLGPAPESASTTRFCDNLPMVLPIVLSVLLTFLLGIHTPAFLNDWIGEAVAFLQRAPN